MAAPPNGALDEAESWLQRIGWLLLAGAIVAVIVRSTGNQAGLLAGIEVDIRWGCVLVTVAVTQRLRGGSRWGFIMLATLIATEASDLSLRPFTDVQAMDGRPDPIPLLALIGGCLSVATLSWPGVWREHWRADLSQQVLDIALILGSGALALATLHAVELPLGAMPRQAFYLVTLDVLHLLAFLFLLTEHRSLPWRVLAPLTLSVGCVMITHIASAAILPTRLGQLDTSTNLLGQALITLAACVWQRPPTISGRSSDQTNLTMASPLPSVAAALAISAMALSGTLFAAPLLAVLGVGALRELLIALRRRWHIRQLGKQIEQERELRCTAAASAQQHVVQLARLIHDQAAPIQGLWRIQGQLATARHAGAAPLLDNLELLQTLADQLRNVLRGEPAMRTLRRDVINVQEIAAATIAAATHRADISAIDLSLITSTPDTQAIGDAIAVRRVLDNLMTNALDATPKRGQVAIEIWVDRSVPDMLTITVRDSGPGFASDSGQPFAARFLGSGSVGLGLGLSIVRELVDAMGGNCGVSSEPGKGSRVWFRLPHCEAAKQGKRRSDDAYRADH